MKQIQVKTFDWSSWNDSYSANENTIKIQDEEELNRLIQLAKENESTQEREYIFEVIEEDEYGDITDFEEIATVYAKSGSIGEGY